MSRGLALVTGASSGLGAEFARALARRKMNLVLVARRAEPMERLADELRKRHEIEVLVQPMDLASPGSVAILDERLDELKIAPDILVNNAAFGLSGFFLDQDPARIREMLQLDILSLVELTHTFGRRMIKGSGGNVLLVASLAAYQPDPLLAAYGVAKELCPLLRRGASRRTCPEGWRNCCVSGAYGDGALPGLRLSAQGVSEAEHATGERSCGAGRHSHAVR
jgi:short-subunit dehydrogenase